MLPTKFRLPDDIGGELVRAPAPALQREAEPTDVEAFEQFDWCYQIGTQDGIVSVFVVTEADCRQAR